MVHGAALEKRSALLRSVGSNPTLSATPGFGTRGEVLEWTIRRAWRARVASCYRGFESHPLRQYTGDLPVYLSTLTDDFLLFTHS